MKNLEINQMEVICGGNCPSYDACFGGQALMGGVLFGGVGYLVGIFTGTATCTCDVSDQQFNN